MKIKNSKYLLNILLILSFFTQVTFAKTAQEIDSEVDKAVENFKKYVPGGAKFLTQTKGYLVFPSVVDASLVVGGKYDEGALRSKGKTQHYYDITSASIGLQAGIQVHSMLVAFLSDISLNNFIRSNGWESGIDTTLTISNWGESKNICSISYEKPIVIFIYSEKGFMISVNINGTKFRRIMPEGKASIN